MLRAWAVAVSCLLGAGLCLAGSASGAVKFSPAIGNPTAGEGGGLLRAVDLDSDGLDDLAAGSFDLDPGGVGIRLAKPDGSWTEKPRLAAGSSVGNVAATDLDRDGTPDLVVQFQNVFAAEPVNDRYSVYLGRGDGTFGSPESISVPAGETVRAFPFGQAIRPVDLNLDGEPDLTFALTRGQIAFAVGNGDGTFSPLLVGRVFDGMRDSEGFGTTAAGDFNNDGREDFVYGMLGDLNGPATADNAGLLLLQRGSGGDFSQIRVPAIEPYGTITGLVVQDLNQDGFDDLIGAAASGEGEPATRIFVHYGSAGGIEAKPGTHVRSIPHVTPYLLDGDFSGDGALDLLWPTTRGGDSGSLFTDLVVAPGKAGAFVPQTGMTPLGGLGEMVGLERGDFNGDGAPDVAASFRECGTATCAVSVLLNRPDPSVSPTSLDFGAVTRTANRPGLPITLTNSGGAPLRVNQVLGSPGIDVTGSCETVVPGGSCVYTVLLDASREAEVDATVQIAIAGANRLEIPVKGSVVAPVIPPPPPPPPPLTYRAKLKVVGPKKLKAGRRLKVTALVTSTGNGPLAGAVLRWRAVHRGRTVDSGRSRLPRIAVQGKVARSIVLKSPPRRLKPGKPVRISAMVVHGGKTLATRTIVAMVRR